MDLKLWKHSQGRQTAEDYIIVYSPAGLTFASPFLLEGNGPNDFAHSSQPHMFMAGKQR
jgi:hypothetical protein